MGRFDLDLFKENLQSNIMASENKNNVGSGPSSNQMPISSTSIISEKERLGTQVRPSGGYFGGPYDLSGQIYATPSQKQLSEREIARSQATGYMRGDYKGFSLKAVIGDEGILEKGWRCYSRII